MAVSRISQAEWSKYSKLLSQISEKASTEFLSFCLNNGGYANIERQTLIDYAYALQTKYGEASAAAAAEWYDGVAALQKVSVPAAIPAETASYHKTAKTVNGVIKNVGNEEVLASSVGLLTKDAGQKTIIQNARRDKAEIAFIVNGDTCAYCIALAAEGWKDASASAIGLDGEPAHLHPNCDCTYGVRFNPKLDYAGYDSDKYAKMYYGADTPMSHPKAKDRINAMRREFYKENSEEINEQKRDAYAKRQERNSSKAEEDDISG